MDSTITIKITLPDYKKIAEETEKRNVEVTKEEIDNLKAEKEKTENIRWRQEILEKISQSTEVEIPDVLAETEVKQMIESLKKEIPQMLQISFEDYLTRIKKNEKEFLESLLPEAKKRIKNSLILREIGKKETIGVSIKEVEDEVNKILSQNPNLEKNLDLVNLKNYTEEILKNEKTFKFLENIAK